MFLWFITRIPIRYATHNIIKTPDTRLGTSVLRFSVCPKSVALSRREVMDKKGFVLLPVERIQPHRW
jgi:hypothetical protein